VEKGNKMIESILRKMNEWSGLGEISDRKGNRIIAHTPRDYPEAYLHYFYTRRSDRKWRKYGMKLPNQLCELYRECNGISLFADSLSIYGIRDNYDRRLHIAQFQPYDLKDHDSEHRTCWHKLPNSIDDDRVFFGSYNWDGSGVYVTSSADTVYRCLRNEYKPVNEWSNIEMFLNEEYGRLEKLFDENGYVHDEEVETTPITKT
jgi:hypothetical protein